MWLDAGLIQTEPKSLTIRNLYAILYLLWPKDSAVHFVSSFGEYKLYSDAKVNGAVIVEMFPYEFCFRTYDWSHEHQTNNPDAGANHFGSLGLSEPLGVNRVANGEETIKRHHNEQKTRGKLVERSERHEDLFEIFGLVGLLLIGFADLGKC